MRLIVLMLAALFCGCYGKPTSQQLLELLPWETRDILLQLEAHLGIKQLTGKKAIKTGELAEARM
jgi:hypothetical protein